jgi:hypothetical protein
MAVENGLQGKLAGCYGFYSKQAAARQSVSRAVVLASAVAGGAECLEYGSKPAAF